MRRIDSVAAYRAAFNLWVMFYAETETYDRTLPGTFHHHHRATDEWMPRGDCMSDSNRFAIKAAAQVTRALNLLEIDESVSVRARDEARSLPYSEHRRLAALVGD